MSHRLYLGVFLCAAKQCKMNIKQARASFYKSLNLLLSRGRETFDDIVMLHFIKKFCLPVHVLLYGSECLDCMSSYDSCIDVVELYRLEVVSNS